MKNEDDLLHQFLTEDPFNKTELNTDFTADVLTKIEQKKARYGKPIIGKYGWIVAAFFAIVLVILPFFVYPASTNTYFNTIKVADLYPVVEKLKTPLLGILAVLTLIVLDELIRKRTRKFTP